MKIFFNPVEPDCQNTTSPFSCLFRINIKHYILHSVKKNTLTFLTQSELNQNYLSLRKSPVHLLVSNPIQTSCWFRNVKILVTKQLINLKVIFCSFPPHKVNFDPNILGHRRVVSQARHRAAVNSRNLQRVQQRPVL